MKRHFILQFSFLFLICCMSYSQVPDGFNYQALARNASGNPIVNTTLLVKISILSDTTGFYLSNAGTYIWEEQHTVTTNNLGLFSLVIGSPDARRIAGSTATFSEIDWNAKPTYIGIKIQAPSSAWTNLGTAKLWSVPYAMVSEKATLADAAGGLTSGAKISITGKDDTSTDALFEVKRKDGQTVFAVYPDAVNVYVPRSVKGAKGGFAIGGFDGSKAAPQDYFRVTPDSVRIYIDPNPVETKGGKGGFAIGGFVGEKGIDDMYFNLSGGSTVNTVVESPQILWYPVKKAFLAGTVHIGAVDSVGTNSTALGFRSIAMGQYSQAFGYKARAFGDYSTSIGKNSVAGSKSAPLANNAFAFGDAAKALGENSIAFGKEAQATGASSMAIGVNSLSSGTTALSYGNGSQATGSNSVAIGNSNTAGGSSSLAMGNNSTASSQLATAIGFYAQATGVKSVSIGANYFKTIYIKPLIPVIRPPIILPPLSFLKGSDAVSDPTISAQPADQTKGGFITLPSSINRNNIAEGEYSLAIGNGNYAVNGGIAIGVYNDALAQFATGIGFGNKASALNSFAAGYANTSDGEFSTAFGRYTNATSENSFVIGRFNDPIGTSTDWVETEPLFQIGNGSAADKTHDAVRVLKNGGTYINGTNAYTGLWIINKNTADNPNSSFGLGIMSGIQRNKAGLTYYSGYFYDAGGSQGTYNGLYADVRTGQSIDLAEYIYSDGKAEPADVVIADPGKKESVVRSSKPYQASVLGVISTKPHLTMGMELVTDPVTGEPIANVSAARLALSGRVPVNVTGENGNIVPGDYLTSSSTPGAAMKWTLLDVNEAKDFNDLKMILAENEKRRNAIIGKAVESFTGTGTGKIIVLVSLQ